MTEMNRHAVYVAMGTYQVLHPDGQPRLERMASSTFKRGQFNSMNRKYSTLEEHACAALTFKNGMTPVHGLQLIQVFELSGPILTFDPVVLAKGEHDDKGKGPVPDSR